ncbi:CE1759 family FMN reductase [Couchioplanes azureus]|uniref:CE1759 family FMN reductase n=1 Tax=Couchioplanes caeruleus TaxID=56438 RepID=UPI001671856B|nr:CE1759 family FMN reductase [Couchioplanes caeruleus]GGQ61977.1 FMN reductase [Couchioplanes caeruleus subsp. azureus]
MTSRDLVVVTAGLSQPSSTRLLADRLSAAAVDQAGRAGVDLRVRVVELRDLAHDLMNHMLTGFPPAPLREVLDALAAADALIAVTPVFHASYSGLFKSFFDVLDKDVLDGKPVLIAATGGSARHSLALEHAVRPMFAYLRAVTVPTAVFAAPEDWGGDETEGQLRRRAERAAAELAGEIARREAARPVDPFALTTSFEDLLAG